MLADPATGQSGAVSRVTILYLTLPGFLIFMGGFGCIVGTFVPWATVSSGAQLRSLLNLSFSFSISPIDIDAGYAWIIVLGGAVCVAAALRLAVARGKARWAGVAATLSAVAAGLATFSVASHAQEAGASVGWLGSLIDTTSLLAVSPGIGFWLALGASGLGTVGGLLACLGK